MIATSSVPQRPAARASFRGGPGIAASLKWLLLAQVMLLFVAVPLAALHGAGLWLGDAARLVYAGVCIRVFTRNRVMRALLAAAVVLTIALPALAGRMGGATWSLVAQHEWLTWTVALFNAMVTVLVARYVFGPGRVGADRVLGAVLIYLNFAALFVSIFGLITLLDPAGIHGLAPLAPLTTLDRRDADLTYFSLCTITSTGFGDLVPLHALTRSLCNVEAVIGQLFPATVIARLVGLHLAHGQLRRRASPPNE